MIETNTSDITYQLLLLRNPSSYEVASFLEVSTMAPESEYLVLVLFPILAKGVSLTKRLHLSGFLLPRLRKW